MGGNLTTICYFRDVNFYYLLISANSLTKGAYDILVGDWESLQKKDRGIFDTKKYENSLKGNQYFLMDSIYIINMLDIPLLHFCCDDEKKFIHDLNIKKNEYFYLIKKEKSKNLDFILKYLSNDPASTLGSTKIKNIGRLFDHFKCLDSSKDFKRIRELNKGHFNSNY
jgi:hypothetical protein